VNVCQADTGLTHVRAEPARLGGNDVCQDVCQQRVSGRVSDLCQPRNGIQGVATCVREGNLSKRERDSLPFPDTRPHPPLAGGPT
jgi:hypothetical protein